MLKAHARLRAKGVQASQADSNPLDGVRKLPCHGAGKLWSESIP